MNEDFILYDRDQLNELLDLAREAVEVGPHRIIIEKVKKQRSIPQNRSLHKYCSIIAEKMNDAGTT